MHECTGTCPDALLAALMTLQKGRDPGDIPAVSCRVPALPVKNLNGTGPVHPALAGNGWGPIEHP